MTGVLSCIQFKAHSLKLLIHEIRNDINARISDAVGGVRLSKYVVLGYSNVVKNNKIENIFPTL